MATEPQNPRVITPAEFHASREYRTLTDRQRKWVDIVVTSNDPERATAEAFGATANDAYAKMLQGKLETSPRVRAAIHLFYGYTEREVFLQDLKTDLRRSRPGSIARTKFAAMYAKLAFGADPEDPEIPAAESEPTTDKSGTDLAQQFPIGSVIVQDGRKYRVVAQEIE
jgi:hypothetical protein